MAGKEKEPPIDLFYLWAWPLLKRESGQLYPKKMSVQRLDFEAEGGTLDKVLTECNKRINFYRDIATLSALRRGLSTGVRVIHFTGHGTRDQTLAFENLNTAEMEPIKPRDLHHLVKAGEGKETVDCVVVSACYSEEAGRSFVAAGVKHVIAVNKDKQVEDKNSQRFLEQFYSALFAGRTIRAAFEAAVALVRLESNVMDQAGVFLLLPEEENHDVVIFSDLRPGTLNNMGPKSMVDCRHNVIPVCPANYHCRNFEMQEAVQHLMVKKNAIVTLAGASGIGKTVIAAAVARYIKQRIPQNKVAAVYWVDEFAAFVGPGVIRRNSSVGELALLASPTTPQTPLTNLAEFVGSKIDKKANIQSEDDLIAYLREKKTQSSIADDHKIVLCLDGVQYLRQECASRHYECCKENNNFTKQPGCLTRFTDNLFQKCGGLAILTTTDLEHQVIPEDFIGQGEEHVMNIGELSPEESAQLFYNSVKRKKKEITCAELGCAMQPRDRFKKLREHPVLKHVKGNPKEIIRAAKLLTDQITIDQLYDKLMEKETKARLEEQKRQQQQLERRQSAHTPTPGPATPGPAPPSLFSPPINVAVSPDVFSEQSLYNQDVSGTAIWQKHFGHQGTARMAHLKQLLLQYFQKHARVRFRTLGEYDLEAIESLITRLTQELKLPSQYIQPDFFTREAFIAFWPWFVSFVDIVSQMRDVWCQEEPAKLIYGIATRNRANKLLQDYKLGTFLLRFSENQQNALVCSYLGTPDGQADSYRHPEPVAIHSAIAVKRDSDGSLLFELNVDNSWKQFRSLDDLVLMLQPLQYLYPDIEKERVFTKFPEEPA